MIRTTRRLLALSVIIALYSSFSAFSSNNVNHRVVPISHSFDSNEEMMSKTIPSINKFLGELPVELSDNRQLNELSVWLQSQPDVICATLIRQSCKCQSCINDKVNPPISEILVLVDDNGIEKELFLHLSAGESMQVERFSRIDIPFRWVVYMKLKPRANESYSATEDSEIKALILKHDIEMIPHPGGLKHPEFSSYYMLRGTGSSCKENTIKDFFATGKFEDWIHSLSGFASSFSCASPISVNDPCFLNEHGWALELINAPCAWTITKAIHR